jgi:hypothetical protein
VNATGHDRRDRFRHRNEPEDRVAPERLLRLQIHHARQVNMDLFIPGCERRHAGNLPAIDIAAHRFLQVPGDWFRDHAPCV